MDKNSSLILTRIFEGESGQLLSSYRMSAPPPVAARYTVVEGDSYALISQKLFRDTSFAQAIASENGDTVSHAPTAGDTLRIPPLMEVHNGASNSASYEQFISTLVGSLYPHLIAKPKGKHHSWWKEVIEVVAAVVLAVLLPEVFAPLFAALGSTLAGIATAAASAAVDNAVVQGVAIGFGDQQGFSLADVGIAGAEGGLTAGLSVGNVAGNSSLQRLGNQLQQTLKITIATQLADMAFGKTQQFNFSTVASAVGAVLLNAPVNARVGPGMLRDTLNITTSNLLAASFTNGHLDIQRFAATTIGTMIGQESGIALSRPLEHYEEALSNSHAMSRTPSLSTPTHPAQSLPLSSDPSRPEPAELETATEGRRRLQRWQTQSSSSGTNWRTGLWRDTAQTTETRLLEQSLGDASSQESLSWSRAFTEELKRPMNWVGAIAEKFANLSEEKWAPQFAIASEESAAKVEAARKTMAAIETTIFRLNHMSPVMLDELTNQNQLVLDNAASAIKYARLGGLVKIGVGNLGKVAVGYDIYEGYEATKHAPSGERLRVGIDETAKIVGARLGAVAGVVSSGKLHLGFLSAVALTGISSAAGAASAEAFADHIYRYYSGDNSEWKPLYNK